jgi:hypothetical protein
MAWLRKGLWGMAGVILLLTAGLLAWSLPRHEVLRIDGTEVRRNDGTTVRTTDQTPIRKEGVDMYYIYASNPEGTDVIVYRNEDTGFGFPWYFKMDAAEVQGRAQLLSRKDGQLALVTYYGWRIPVLGLFPNAVDVVAWDRPEEPLPIFNITFLTLLTIAVTGSARKLRRWRRARALRKTGIA